MLSRTPPQQSATTTQGRWTTTNSEPEAEWRIFGSLEISLLRVCCWCERWDKKRNNEVSKVSARLRCCVRERLRKAFQQTPPGKLSLFVVLLFQPRHWREFIINDCAALLIVPGRRLLTVSFRWVFVLGRPTRREWLDDPNAFSLEGEAKRR